jgi:hypothetical protein
MAFSLAEFLSFPNITDAPITCPTRRLWNSKTGVWTFFAAELANIKPGGEAWIAAQRLSRLAQVL